MVLPDVQLPRIRLALPVDDLASASRFYGQALGCTQRGLSDTWIEWDLWGHQLVTHLAPTASPTRMRYPIDGRYVPVPHVGLLLESGDFDVLAERLRAVDATFVIEPYLRFAGTLGEQWTMLLADPAGNAVEFTAYER